MRVPMTGAKEASSGHPQVSPVAGLGRTRIDRRWWGDGSVVGTCLDSSCLDALISAGSDGGEPYGYARRDLSPVVSDKELEESTPVQPDRVLLFIRPIPSPMRSGQAPCIPGRTSSMRAWWGKDVLPSCRCGTVPCSR